MKKIPEEKIPWGQNHIWKKSHVGKYPKRTKSNKEKNPTRKYSIFFFLVSLKYILRSQFSNVENLRIFFITYPFFAHYLCFTFIVRWRACTRLCSLYLRIGSDNWKLLLSMYHSPERYVIKLLWIYCCSKFIVVKAFLIIDFSYIFKYTS